MSERLSSSTEPGNTVLGETQPGTTLSCLRLWTFPNRQSHEDHWEDSCGMSPRGTPHSSIHSKVPLQPLTYVQYRLMYAWDLMTVSISYCSTAIFELGQN